MFIKRVNYIVSSKIILLQAHHRCISRSQAIGFLEDELDRGQDAAEARYAESSMRNGFGLKFLHRFLNLPFLTLQRESLLKQLETNKREMNANLQELDLFLESDDANYELYSSGVTKKRRTMAENLAPKPTIDVVVGQPSNTFKDPKFQPLEKNQDISKSMSPSATLELAAAKAEKAKSPSPQPNKIQPSVISIVSSNPVVKSPSKNSKLDVDDFVPDTDAIENFLQGELDAFF